MSLFILLAMYQQYLRKGYFGKGVPLIYRFIDSKHSITFQSKIFVEQISFPAEDSLATLESCTGLCKSLWFISVNYTLHFPCSNGSATSEDLFWKLDALQMFVLDLHWPEPEFAKHLEQRLKLMASDMMEACVKRSD